MTDIWTNAYAYISRTPYVGSAAVYHVADEFWLVLRADAELRLKKNLKGQLADRGDVEGVTFTAGRGVWVLTIDITDNGGSAYTQTSVERLLEALYDLGVRGHSSVHIIPNGRRRNLVNMTYTLKGRLA